MASLVKNLMPILRPFESIHPKMQVTAQACPLSGQRLQLAYRLQGDLGALHWPKVQASQVSQNRRAHGLWQTTCFEAFVQAEQETAYLELNFSPAGLWNAYRFTGYRQPANHPPPMTDRVHLERLEAHATGLLAVVVLTDLWPATTALHVGMTAVLHERNGRLTHWALQHGGVDADFHRAGDWRLSTVLRF